MDKNLNDEYMTLSELAEYFKCSLATLLRYVVNDEKTNFYFKFINLKKYGKGKKGRAHALRKDDLSNLFNDLSYRTKKYLITEVKAEKA